MMLALPHVPLTGLGGIVDVAVIALNLLLYGLPVLAVLWLIDRSVRRVSPSYRADMERSEAKQRQAEVVAREKRIADRRARERQERDRLAGEERDRSDGPP